MFGFYSFPQRVAPIYPKKQFLREKNLHRSPGNGTFFFHLAHITNEQPHAVVALQRHACSRPTRGISSHTDVKAVRVIAEPCKKALKKKRSSLSHLLFFLSWGLGGNGTRGRLACLVCSAKVRSSSSLKDARGFRHHAKQLWYQELTQLASKQKRPPMRVRHGSRCTSTEAGVSRNCDSGQRHLRDTVHKHANAVWVVSVWLEKHFKQVVCLKKILGLGILQNAAPRQASRRWVDGFISGKH